MMMVGRLRSQTILLRRIGLGLGRALSAGGAEVSSPGRKPGVGSPFFEALARESGRQKEARNKLHRGDHTSRSSVARTGLSGLKTTLPPGLRPGLHYAAHSRGLIEGFHLRRQGFPRLPTSFIGFIAVVAISCSTLQLNVMAQTNRGMNSTHTNTVLLPNRSPLVSFRILFMTGSAFH